MSLLVMVDEVYVSGITIIETEDNPPIAGYVHRPKTCQATTQWMQPESGFVDVLGAGSLVQLCQDVLNLRDVVRWNASPVSPFVKALQTMVLNPIIIRA